jgi:signal transduction histidine kinase
VFVVKPLWLSTSDALSDIVLDYQPIARAKAIDLSFTVGSTKERVWADPLALKRILGNLVSNALKFTPKGGRVVVSAERFPEATRLSVSDSGVGIDAKDRHLLFERYSRLEKHQTVDGTGLGLFVTKHLVDAHSGRIEVKSEVGRGTQFTVWLPHAEGARTGVADPQVEKQVGEKKVKESHPGE